jgi:hypothetical protein
MLESIEDVLYLLEELLPLSDLFVNVKHTISFLGVVRLQTHLLVELRQELYHRLLKRSEIGIELA